MRELKFRVYSKIYGKGEFVVTASIVIDEKNKSHIVKIVETAELENHINKVVQFTGLKDKNGKEIYQGDILKIKADKDGYGSTSYGGYAEIQSEVCGFNFRCFNPTFKQIDKEWSQGGADGWDSSSLWHTSEPENIEVIGNIYENPELIKEDK